MGVFEDKLFFEIDNLDNNLSNGIIISIFKILDILYFIT